MKITEQPGYHLIAYHVSDILTVPLLREQAESLTLGYSAGMQTYLRKATSQSKAVGVFACVSSQPIAWALCVQELDAYDRFVPSNYPEGATAIHVFVLPTYRRQGVAMSLLTTVAAMVPMICVYDTALQHALLAKGIAAAWT